MKEVEQTARRRRERGRREVEEVLQLYPELQGSQEFHPWKSILSFPLSHSLSLENSERLDTAAVHTLSHCVTYEDRQSILPSFSHFFPSTVSRTVPVANAALP